MHRGGEKNMTDPQATCGCEPKFVYDLCPIHGSKSDPAAKAREIADKILDHRNLGYAHKHCSHSEAASLIAADLEAERKAGYEEGKRDSIIEFCEGDRSMLAEYEHKADAEGYRRGLEEAATMATKFCTCSNCSGIANRIRAMYQDGEGK